MSQEKYTEIDIVPVSVYKRRLRQDRLREKLYGIRRCSSLRIKFKQEAAHVAGKIIRNLA